MDSPDAQVSLILGPERYKSQLIDACLAEQQDELSIRRLRCPQCGCLGTDRREPICSNCDSPLETIRDTSDEWLREQAWQRLRWEVPGFQARTIVPDGLVGELYPGNSVRPPDLVLPLSLVLERLLESMQNTRSRYIRECWDHLSLGNSVREMLPRGENVRDKHRHYLVTREKLIAGYNWLTGLAHQHPEFLDGDEPTGIRRFPPAVILGGSISDTPAPDQPTGKAGPKASRQDGARRRKRGSPFDALERFGLGSCPKALAQAVQYLA